MLPLTGFQSVLLILLVFLPGDGVITKDEFVSQVIRIAPIAEARRHFPRSVRESYQKCGWDYLGASPRPPTPKGSNMGFLRSFGLIFLVQEGFRIVQNCDWIHLDLVSDVSGQNHHSHLFWIFGTLHEAVSGTRK